MSFPKDKKDKKEIVPEFLDEEEERRTFGQQAPFATSSNTHTPTTEQIEPHTPRSPVDTNSLSTAHPTAPSNISPVVSPSTTRDPHLQYLQPQHSNRPDPVIHQDEDELNDSELPPSYDESQRIRDPQQYQPENYNQENSNPSAPLLGNQPPHGRAGREPQGRSQAPQETQYSTIPIPRSTSHPPSLSGSSFSTESQRSRKYNRFWIIFFVVIMLLMVFSDEEDKSASKRCNTGDLFYSSIAVNELPPDISDFTLLSTNLLTNIVVEQKRIPDSDFNHISYTIEAFGSVYEDFKEIQHETRVSATDRLLKESLTFGNSPSPRSECLGVTLKIVFPHSVRKIKRLKFQITDGNVTVDLLDPIIGTQVLALESRVITGHSNIRADVLGSARLGASSGSIKGEIAVKDELVVNVVDGNVDLNLRPKRSILVSNSISVTNGNINIGLDGNSYEGNFRLQTTSGSVNVVHADPSRTRLSTITKYTIRGWSSDSSKEPIGGSDMSLRAISGDVVLSMKPFDCNFRTFPCH